MEREIPGPEYFKRLKPKFDPERCASCGSSLLDRLAAGDGLARFQCRACGETQAVILHGDRPVCRLADTPAVREGIDDATREISELRKEAVVMGRKCEKGCPREYKHRGRCAKAESDGSVEEDPDLPVQTERPKETPVQRARALLEADRAQLVLQAEDIRRQVDEIDGALKKLGKV